MSKILLAFPAFILLVLTSTPKPDKPDVEQSKRELLKLEDQWLQASSDAGVQEIILADDFVHVLPEGFITKKQQIRFVRNNKRSDNGLMRRFENVNVRIYGSVGVVNGIVAATDRSGAVVKKTIFTDVFAYRNGRWQAVNAQENEIRRSANR